MHRYFSVTRIIVEHADTFVYQLDKPAQKVCLLCGGIPSLFLHDVCSRAFHVTGYTGNFTTMICFMKLPRTVIYQQQQFSYNSQFSISPKCSFFLYIVLSIAVTPQNSHFYDFTWVAVVERLHCINAASPPIRVCLDIVCSLDEDDESTYISCINQAINILHICPNVKTASYHGHFNVITMIQRCFIATDLKCQRNQSRTKGAGWSTAN